MNIITISSINILNDKFYTKYSDNKGMNINKRQELFNEIFKNELINKDIIAFQECGYKPSLPLNIVKKENLAIYYNSSKFTEIKSEYIPF